ncbi:MAG: hypothetical protein JO316_02885 [Abitibacteriaceae bacterium]|nr:hypothetical protein [Abditibacteriaceae bacterium]MBV9864275.1 hypothetical protein [Abditibacteriaceae bacterium]
MKHGLQPLCPSKYSLRTGLALSILGGGLVWGSVAPVQAFPTSVPILGPTGLGFIPTTDTVPAQQGEVSASYEKVNPNVGKVTFAPVLTANYGLRRAELGVAYLHERTEVPGFTIGNHYTTLHAKYLLLESAKSGAALAVGVHHLDFGGLPGKVNSLYLVGSYPVWRREDRNESVRAHLGVIHHRISGGGAITNATRPMGGIDWAVNQEVTLAADYTPRRGAAVPLWSIVARYQKASTPSWGVELGYGRQNGSDDKFFAGVNYRFGKAAE